MSAPMRMPLGTGSTPPAAGPPPQAAPAMPDPGPAADSDRRLVLAARRGDVGAFERLVRRHTPMVYRVALRIVQNGADAEDCVQDAWLSAWRGLSRYRADGAASTWLYRVTTNAALMQVRGRRPLVPLSPVHDIATAEAGIDAVAEVDAVRRALAQITVEQRTVIVLREYEGLSYDEIAQILDLSVPAVRSRLHRARAELARSLEEWR